MGTDFNYLYSEEMRKIIDENCMEANKEYVNLKEYVDPYRDEEWADYLPDNQARNMNDPQFLNQIQEII